MAAKWLARAQSEGCGILPPLAERILMNAAKVGTPGSPARQRAIEHAYERTSNLFPDIFRD